MGSWYVRGRRRKNGHLNPGVWEDPGEGWDVEHLAEPAVSLLESLCGRDRRQKKLEMNIQRWRPNVELIWRNWRADSFLVAFSFHPGSKPAGWVASPSFVLSLPVSHLQALPELWSTNPVSVFQSVQVDIKIITEVAIIEEHMTGVGDRCEASHLSMTNPNFLTYKMEIRPMWQNSWSNRKRKYWNAWQTLRLM